MHWQMLHVTAFKSAAEVRVRGVVFACTDACPTDTISEKLMSVCRERREARLCRSQSSIDHQQRPMSTRATHSSASAGSTGPSRPCPSFLPFGGPSGLDQCQRFRQWKASAPPAVLFCPIVFVERCLGLTGARGLPRKGGSICQKCCFFGHEYFRGLDGARLNFVGSTDSGIERAMRRSVLFVRVSVW